MTTEDQRRRRLLAAGAAAGVGAVAGVVWLRSRQPGPHEVPAAPPSPATVALAPDPDFPHPLILPGADGLGGILDASGAMTMVARSVDLPPAPGRVLPVLGYEVEHAGKRYINPLIRVSAGTEMRIRFWNALDEPSIIHWHGLKVDSNNDGHPHYAVAAGKTYDYRYTVANRAGTCWYHPHPHGLTGKQTYLGLAGLFIIEDDDERALQKALGLTLGVTDIPLVLQDRRLDAAGRPVYAPQREQAVHGHFGDFVAVNSTERPYFDASARIHRFRIVNASNARLYRLAFRQGEKLLPFQVIGNDGGLIDHPVTVTEAFVSPAERTDVLLDLRATPIGTAVTLVSLPFDPMHHENGVSKTGEHTAHGGHGDHPAHGEHSERLTDGAPIDILRIRVASPAPGAPGLPASLSPAETLSVTGETPRVIAMDYHQGQWRIDRRTYDMASTPIVVRRGSIEVWEFANAARSMPHPMHVHGVQFRVLQRSGSPEQQRRLAINTEGLAATDAGWKDTVLVWPGERVRIAIDFTHPYLGDQVYMLHCHNLEHEDQGMMVNFKITS